MAQLGLDAIATKILAAYNTQVERNKEVVESNGRAFEQAMETIKAVYLTHSQQGGAGQPPQQQPAVSADGQQQPVALPTFTGTGQAASQAEGLAPGSSSSSSSVAVAASSSAPSSSPATTALMQQDGSLLLPLSLSAAGPARVEAVALPSFPMAGSPDTAPSSSSTAMSATTGLVAAPATPTARPAVPESGGAGGLSGSALSVLTPPDLISGLALQGDGDGTLLPPRVRRKRRGSGGLGPSGVRRLGGFSEEVERALSSFRQYLTRFHVSSFTGQKLSETTVHYRVAAVRRLLAAAGKNEVSPHVLEDLRRACADDRNALNAISDLESFLLHHHRPGATDLDLKLGPSATTAFLKPPAAAGATTSSSSGEAPSSSSTSAPSNGGGPAASSGGAEGASGGGSSSLGEDLAIALMPSPNMLLAAAMEGVVAPPQQQPRMRMPAAGKDLVRWMSHEKGGKVSISTAYSYGRYLMYDLLPKAGFKADEDGGRQGGAGLKTFVLRHRLALETMLPPCRLPYPRERAAWKLLYEYASGKKIWEEEGDFWTNRGKRKQQLLQHKQAAAQHKQQLLLVQQQQQQQAMRGAGAAWSTPLGGKAVKHSLLLRDEGAGRGEEGDDETDEEGGGVGRDAKRAKQLFEEDDEEEEDGYDDYDEEAEEEGEVEGEYDEEDEDEDGVRRSYGLNGAGQEGEEGMELEGEDGDDDDDDDDEGEGSSSAMDEEDEEGRAAASLAAWAKGGSALLRRAAEVAEAAQASTTTTTGSSAKAAIEVGAETGAEEAASVGKEGQVVVEEESAAVMPGEAAASNQSQ